MSVLVEVLIEMTMENPYLLWAKLAGRDEEGRVRRFHPLVCHMIDVGVVTRRMWRETIAASARREIANSLGLTEREAENWVAFLAALHDLGKASPVFQLRREAKHLHHLYSHLGTPPNIEARDCPHGRVTAGELPELLQSILGLNREVAVCLATMTGGHHGVFPTAYDLEANYPDRAVGKKRWKDLRRDLTLQMATLFGVDSGSVPRQGNHSATMLLAGLISVADWIGSNSDYFSYLIEDCDTFPTISLVKYMEQAEIAADQALNRLGWMGWSQPEQALPFTELFELDNPRPLQVAAIEVAKQIDPPGIVIIEAPMGEGKTEAALYLADTWGITPGPRGCYIALPTQATSNQMFTRVHAFLSARYPVDKVNLQLLHGHANLSSEFKILRRNGDRAFTLDSVCGEEGCGEGASSVVAAEWFTHRKRGLLAPFGVGTIDQALLGVLQTRHVFVRLFGLSHKVVLIDEVHAYDTYMSRLLERLLEWLAALGSPVVLLSATLPNQKRISLLNAYRKGLGRPITVDQESKLEARYPRLSWATSQTEGSQSIDVSERIKRRLKIEWVNDDLPLGQRLASALAQGGCAAVICNTVNRAQQVYLDLKPYFSPDELDLFHARFLFGARQERENRTLIDYGKEGAQINDGDEVRSVLRPFRKVLVATQVIEQSLDLDFDLMVSDCAPIDLILQRSGRLHRHQRKRNPELGSPTLWIREPALSDDGLPQFDPGSRAVYDEHLLLRSWMTLRRRAIVMIPEDIEALIESVYDQRSCSEPEGSPLHLHWEKTSAAMVDSIREMESFARRVVIPTPTYSDSIFDTQNRQLEEDEPEVHKSLQALTRMVEPSVSVICLTPDQLQRINLQETPQGVQIRELLRSSVTLSSKKILWKILEESPPPSWRRSSLLRNYRLLKLDENSSCTIGKYQLKVDQELGVMIGDSQQEREH